jgi:hypothetical protein
MVSEVDKYSRKAAIHVTQSRRAGFRIGPVPFWVSSALVIVSLLAAGVTFFVPSILRGPAVMNGSARGTALVVIAVDVPMLGIAMWFATRGSYRSLIVWLGAIAGVLYQSVLFLFFTPFNSLFLLYVALFALCFWSALTLLHEIDVEALARRFSPTLPARGLAAYVLVVVVLNAAIWLRQIIPSTFSSGTPSWLEGTGMATNPIFVQDLAFWLPIMTVAAIWLWRRRPWGYLVVGSVLTMWVVESISIAVDQTFGHAADPLSPVASSSIVPVFVVLAVIGLIPVHFFYRRLTGP